MEQTKSLCETLILIDVSYLNSVIRNLKSHFEMTLQRPLQKINIADLLVYFALEGGVRNKGNSVQVVFVYEKDSSTIYHATPSDLSSELNNVAFMDELGEFIINSYQPEIMVNREQLYIEFLRILLESDDIKRYLLVSSNEEYGNKIAKVISNRSNKNIIEFRLNEPTEPIDWHWELLAYPIMQALGIKGNELN